MGVAFQKWANKNLAKPPGYEDKEIKMVSPEVEAKARQFANDLAEQMIANPEVVKANSERQRLWEFVRKVNTAGDAMTTWAQANPHEPLAQQVLADLLEICQRPGGLENEANAQDIAGVLLKASDQLKKEGRLPVKKTELAAELGTTPDSVCARMTGRTVGRKETFAKIKDFLDRGPARPREPRRPSFRHAAVGPRERSSRFCLS
jgi:hypothetical protein